MSFIELSVTEITVLGGSQVRTRVSIPSGPNVGVYECTNTVNTTPFLILNNSELRFKCLSDQIYKNVDNGDEMTFADGQSYCISNATQSSIIFFIRDAMNGQLINSLTDSNSQDGNLNDPGNWYTLAPTAIISFTIDTSVLFPDLIQVNIGCFCISSDTKIYCCNAGELLPISSMRSGYTIEDYKGRTIAITKMIEFVVPSMNFVSFPQGSLGNSLPYDNVELTHGHTILVDRKKLPCEALLGQNNEVFHARTLPKKVFTIVTRHKTFVNIQGLMVETWSESGWETSCPPKHLWTLK